jgi:hypothetical protein
MIVNFELCTEGVLTILSKVGLKKYFENEEFNYDYPEGILPIINKGSLIALTTESGEEVRLIITTNGMNEFEGYEEIGDQKLFVHTKDELYILNHAEFTQICDWQKGDIDKYEFYNKKKIVAGLDMGWYMVMLFGKESESENFDLEIIVNLTWLKEEPIFIEEFDAVFTI